MALFSLQFLGSEQHPFHPLKAGHFVLLVIDSAAFEIIRHAVANRKSCVHGPQSHTLPSKFEQIPDIFMGEHVRLEVCIFWHARHIIWMVSKDKIHLSKQTMLWPYLKYSVSCPKYVSYQHTASLHLEGKKRQASYSCRAQLQPL